ncbi:hypothetical protein GE09DRAFT_1160852 [Coniochaeta sp. 2T2.1]|nr:hypothetical protein GE09DRAFT_1160852 [Coniochaeta sp. 2T2.1]
MFAKITVLALAAALVVAEETCMTNPARSQPGRDGGAFGDYKCPKQITNCAALCKDKVQTNTCTSDNDGEDTPFQSITYCFDCVCADGSTPDLASYYDTIPYYICSQAEQNCEYRYNQYAKTAPDGACPTCGSQYAVEPTWMQYTNTWPTPTTTAVPTDTGVAEVTTESTTDLLTTSTSTTSSETSSTSSEVSSSPTTTFQLHTTISNSTITTVPTTSHTSTRSRTSTSTRSTSSAPVATGGAALVEPAMAVFGMGLAAVFAL